MNKDNIFFLDNTKYPAGIQEKYIAIEKHSEFRLIIFYRWNFKSMSWEATHEYYRLDIARDEWNRLISIGYMRTKDPYPFEIVGNGVTENRVIV